jgi:hypothetical protein
MLSYRLEKWLKQQWDQHCFCDEGETCWLDEELDNLFYAKNEILRQSTTRYHGIDDRQDALDTIRDLALRSTHAQLEGAARQYPDFGWGCTICKQPHQWSEKTCPNARKQRENAAHKPLD